MAFASVRPLSHYVFVLCALVAFLAPVHFANAQFSLLQKIVPCGDITKAQGTVVDADGTSKPAICFSGQCTTCHLVALAQNLINFFVGFSVIVATLMFVYAGLLYVFAGGNPGQIEKAHHIFADVLIGLIFVLGAWLVIDVVMKAFYDEQKFGPWNEILCDARGGVTQSGQTCSMIAQELAPEGPPILPGDPTQPQPQPQCTTCTPINACGIQATTGCIRVKASACGLGECSVDAELAQNLGTMNGILEGAGIEWQVTEAWPPTVVHANACHAAGTCVDINFDGSTPVTGARVRTVTEAASQSGLFTQYENSDPAALQRIIDAGTPCENVCRVDNITAPHFSVYQSPTSTSCRNMCP